MPKLILNLIITRIHCETTCFQGYAMIFKNVAQPNMQLFLKRIFRLNCHITYNNNTLNSAEVYLRLSRFSQS